MLADHCPLNNGCVSPLFRHRSSGVIECPECRASFRREGADGELTPLERSGSDSTPASTAAGASTKMMNGHVPIGEGGGSDGAAVGGSHYQEYESERTEEEEEELEESAVLTRRQQRNQLSNEIGQLLLRNYTLLGDVCPNPQCYGVPLMRKPAPSREMYCCSCHATVLHESDYQERINNRTVSSNSSSVAETTETVQQHRGDTSGNDNDQGERKEEKSTRVNSACSSLTQRAQVDAPGTKMSSLTLTSSNQTRPSFTNVQGALEKKISALAHSLDQCSINEIDQITRLAAALEQLGRTLKVYSN